MYEKVSELFMNENDRVALTKLCQETSDPIVALALDWNINYEKKLTDTTSNEFKMYDDIIELIFASYNL